MVGFDWRMHLVTSSSVIVSLMIVRNNENENCKDMKLVNMKTAQTNNVKMNRTNRNSETDHTEHKNMIKQTVQKNTKNETSIKK